MANGISRCLGPLARSPWPRRQWDGHSWGDGCMVSFLTYNEILVSTFIFIEFYNQSSFPNFLVSHFDDYFLAFGTEIGKCCELVALWSVITISVDLYLELLNLVGDFRENLRTWEFWLQCFRVHKVTLLHVFFPYLLHFSYVNPCQCSNRETMEMKLWNFVYGELLMLHVFNLFLSFPFPCWYCNITWKKCNGVAYFLIFFIFLGKAWRE